MPDPVIPSPKASEILLRIRPALPDPDEKNVARGPLTMEAVLSSLHSLPGKDGVLSLEIGMIEGKISLFARAARKAAPLVESQLYGQYSDAEIEQTSPNHLEAKEGEIVVSQDLELTDSELFPIKRHPQFIDLASRQSVETIAGVVATLVRCPKPGMRGHVEITFKPVGKWYRKEALKLLPLLMKGIPKRWHAYAKFFTQVHMSRGWRGWTNLPLDILMGGFRTRFSRSKYKVSLMSGEVSEQETDEDEEHKVSARTHEREEKDSGAVDKLNRLLFAVNIRVSVITPEKYKDEAEYKLDEIASSFRQFTLPQSNGFHALKPVVSPVRPKGLLTRPYVLSVEELATLWHIPNVPVRIPNFDYVNSRKLEPPVDLPVVGETDEEITVLGEAVFRGERRQFGIMPIDRMRHIYVIGKTGMGKSTVLENMIFSDIQAGKGVAVIDPHGDLIQACLRFVPKERSNDVILFDPSDKEFPVAFNMLSVDNAEQRTLVVSGLMSVFKKLWPEAFSGRMEYILRNTLLALTEAGNQSMLGIMRMFSDPAFRTKILEHVEDHVVKSFWEDEFTSWSEKYQTEALAAIQNKIGQLLSTPLIRNIVGQVTSKLDVRHAMDTGKIILMNLSKGKLGEDNSAFLGSMFVTKFQLDAMSRADVPEKDRKEFYLYVDEFQNFATESFATILSEARKYKLSLTMAHQYVNQLLLDGGDTALRDAVFGNVGSMVVFQVGSDDAEPLSLQFEEMATPNDILSLPKYHAYVRLMIKGIPSKPFSVGMLPPPTLVQGDDRVEIIRNLSRERYAEKRAVVEEKIAKWVATARQQRAMAPAGAGGGGFKNPAKAKEKVEEEMKKAKAKGMGLDEYRKWRDKEMWTNDYNAYRKKKLLGETLAPEEQAKMDELATKLEFSGGIPPISKGLQAELDKAAGKPRPAKDAPAATPTAPAPVEAPAPKPAAPAPGAPKPQGGAPRKPGQPGGGKRPPKKH